MPYFIFDDLTAVMPPTIHKPCTASSMTSVVCDEDVVDRVAGQGEVDPFSSHRGRFRRPIFTSVAKT